MRFLASMDLSSWHVYRPLTSLGGIEADLFIFKDYNTFVYMYKVCMCVCVYMCVCLYSVMHIKA